jgi:hypothetical protein
VRRTLRLRAAGGTDALTAGARPAKYAAAMPGPPAGLCDSCRHQQVVRNTRGSSFSLCRRSREDDRYPRYPRLPVASCPGHEPRGPEDEEAAAEGGAA